MNEDSLIKKRTGRNTARTNLKRTKLLRNLSKGMNIAEAGRASGYATRQGAHKALSAMRLSLPDVLERIDLPVDKVMTKYKEKMEAKETIHFTHQGIVMETRQVVAHEIQLRATADVARIMGLFPRNGHENGDTGQGDPGPRYVSLTLVNISAGAAAAIMAGNSRGAADHQQLDLEATHEDQGRPGSEPEL